MEERSNWTFHCRRFARACGLRPLCVHTVRSRALPGKRLCPSSRLLSFPSSGSMDSRNRDIVQYRPGGCSCKLRSPIRDLERYRENDCALLLGCSASQVREAWTRAIETLSSIVQVVVPASSDRRYAISSATGKTTVPFFSAAQLPKFGKHGLAQ